MKILAAFIVLVGMVCAQNATPAPAVPLPKITAIAGDFNGTITGTGFGVKPGTLWLVVRFDASSLRGNERAGKYLAFWEFSPPSGRVAVPKEAIANWSEKSITLTWSAPLKTKFMATLRHSNPDLVIDDPFPVNQMVYVVETATGMRNTVAGLSPQALSDLVNTW